MLWSELFLPFCLPEARAAHLSSRSRTLACRLPTGLSKARERLGEAERLKAARTGGYHHGQHGLSAPAPRSRRTYISWLEARRGLSGLREHGASFLGRGIGLDGGTAGRTLAAPG